MNENEIIKNAIDYVKKNKKEIIEDFAGTKYRADKIPVSIFMAGSPGAGKTEVATSIHEVLKEDSESEDAVMIDPDEIRKILPNYNGANAPLFQEPVSLAVNKIHDYVLGEKKNFILDGTFTSDKVVERVGRSIKHKRPTVIIYVYQDPLLAWELVKAREYREGRHIPKDNFIFQYFKAKENVKLIKKHYGNKLTVYVLKKDYKTGEKEFHQNIDYLDSNSNCTFL